GVTTAWENFRVGRAASADLPCLGRRPIVGGQPGAYVWQTYAEVEREARALGALIATHPGLLAGARAAHAADPAWSITELACFAYDLTLVPLHDTLGVEGIAHIIRETRMAAIVLQSLEVVRKALQDEAAAAASQTAGETAENADASETPASKSTSTTTYEVLFWEDAVTAYAAPEKQPAQRLPVPSSVATICYTSGTTGTPKGAVLTHTNMVGFMHATRFLVAQGHCVDYNQQDVYLSYLPLAHVFERALHTCLYHVGARIGFFQGDTLKLVDDLAELRPTIFASVPRLYNRIYDKVLQAVEAKGGIKAWLFKKALAAKTAALHHPTHPSTTHRIYDPVVFAPVRQRLGGRVRLLLAGAAPLGQDVGDFFRAAFACPLLEGYGQTESAAGLTLTSSHNTWTGHLGVPVPNSECKLVDLPELNYTSADQPFPRGEIYTRGPSVFSHYYRQPELTAAALVPSPDGRGRPWLKTGDVGMWDAAGHLVIIDRAKNMFKLAQGEYVAPEKCETVLARHPAVSQCFIYGDGLQSCVVGVAVPDIDVFLKWAKAHHAEAAFLATEVVPFMKTHGSKGFEVPRALYLDPDEWVVGEGKPATREDGTTAIGADILTPTLKIRRPQAKAKYVDVIATLY
ncbi:hypothetical protein CXG81DRAFT_1294, partial [Caulochytrium protostelioides]